MLHWKWTGFYFIIIRMNITEEDIEKAGNEYAPGETSLPLRLDKNMDRNFFRREGFHVGVRWALSQPQKNEGYSIKPLEWVESHMNGTKIFEATGIYMRYEVWNDCWRRYLHDPSESFIHGGDCIDYEDGKRQAQKHFESKIKPYLSVSQPQWIDVKTKWPDHNSWVMVWWPDRSTSPKVALQHYLIGNSVTWTHWQPLPEGPKP